MAMVIKGKPKVQALYTKGLFSIQLQTFLQKNRDVPAASCLLHLTAGRLAGWQAGNRKFRWIKIL